MNKSIKKSNKKGIEKVSLHECCENGDLEAVKKLINSGIDINLKDAHEYTPLHYAACRRRHLEIVKELISAGADVNAKNEVDDTPLHLAIILARSLDITKVLIAAGADVNAKNEVDDTPLLDAAVIGDMEIFAELVTANADITAENYEGYTCWGILQERHPKIAKVMLSAIKKECSPEMTKVISRFLKKNKKASKT